MYDVKRFVKSKREDWDNGCMNMERTDLDYFRYERTHSAMGDVMREYLKAVQDSNNRKSKLVCATHTREKQYSGTFLKGGQTINRLS